MGVTGLWKLIESSGKPVPVETLENKVLAIDISIWLHQVVKGFRDNKGGALENAHLLGLFHRICKLLYYRVKPVFIFDGGVPELKRETISKRSQSRGKLQNETDRLQDLLLQQLAREKIVQQALGPRVTELLTSPSKQKPTIQKPEKDEIFKLPSLPCEADEPNNSSSYYTDSTSETDSSFDEKNPHRSYNHNLQTIDVTSKHFLSLPADVRLEILTDIKETRKQSSWGRLHELPAVSDDFSKFQMKRLLKRRQVQVSLEDAEKQMEGKSLTLNELEALLTEEGIVAASKAESTKRIASDEHTRFLLVKDLKRAVKIAQEAARADEGSSSSQTLKEETKSKVDDGKDDIILGEEYDADLAKAVEMSLQSTLVYDDKDYDYDDQVKLNQDQRQQLKSAANSLARAYMIEYGGMNDDDIKHLLHDDDELSETQELESSFNFKHNDRFIVKGELCTPYNNLNAITEQPEKKSKGNEDEIVYVTSSSESDHDSDFEEVTEINNSSCKPIKNISPKVNLEIVVDTTKKSVNDEDIFADIFQSEGIQALPNSPSSSKAVEMTTSTQDLTGSQLSASILVAMQDSMSPPTVISKADSPIVRAQDFVTIESDKRTKGINIRLAPLCTKRSSPENILAKLRNEIKEVSNITLDELDIIVAAPEKMSYIETISNIEAATTNPSSEVIIGQASSERKQQADTNLAEILENVKKPIAEILKIRLENIVPTESKVAVIDDSDVSRIGMHSTTKELHINDNEIIEIPDSSDSVLGLTTPSKARHEINNYFETEFTIKRTPEKSLEQESHTPKVKSPFFVNNSPHNSSGGTKRKSPFSDKDSVRNPKVSKQLFDKPDKKETENDIRPLEAEPFNALETGASILRENKSREELLNIATELTHDKQDLEAEINKQSRMGLSITHKMERECMGILRLFGIPYIVAPMEAEAQCAFLDAMKLIDGTITDDSDIWLFGGRTVYKNFFNQKKHVFEFKIENIEKLFNIDRYKLIQLAILVGSDYTTGINGIGAVTALEILATFPITPMQEGETTQSMSILSSLRKFRDWWRAGKAVGSGGRTALRSKLKNVELFEGFPNLNIVDAYLHPTIDNNRERFTWGEPDVETIREFTKKSFGWTRNKTDDIIQPVLKRMKERKTQVSIKNYFTVKSSVSNQDLKVSKRVQKAIDKMSSDYKSDTDNSPKPKLRKPRKKSGGVEKQLDGTSAAGPSGTATKRPKKGLKANTNEESVLKEIDQLEVDEIPMKITKKTVHIPNTKQVIPQKEKDKKDMKSKKEKAIEIFKKSKLG